MMIIAVFVSLIAMFIGIYSSFWIDSAPGTNGYFSFDNYFYISFYIKNK